LVSASRCESDALLCAPNLAVVLVLGRGTSTVAAASLCQLIVMLLTKLRALLLAEAQQL